MNQFFYQKKIFLIEKRSIKRQILKTIDYKDIHIIMKCVFSTHV